LSQVLKIDKKFLEAVIFSPYVKLLFRAHIFTVQLQTVI